MKVGHMCQMEMYSSSTVASLDLCHCGICAEEAKKTVKATQEGLSAGPKKPAMLIDPFFGPVFCGI